MEAHAKLAQEVGAKLRYRKLAATGVYLAVRESKLGGDGWQARLHYPTQSPISHKGK